MRGLPVNTIQVGTTQVCAPLKGMPFTPCFNIDKTSEATFRGSVQGMSSFAWCEFRKHGNSLLMARAERGPVSLRARGVRSAEASKPEAPKGETVAKVETPKVEAAKIDPPEGRAGLAGVAPLDGLSLSVPTVRTLRCLAASRYRSSRTIPASARRFAT